MREQNLICLDRVGRSTVGRGHCVIDGQQKLPTILLF